MCSIKYATVSITDTRTGKADIHHKQIKNLCAIVDIAKFITKKKQRFVLNNCNDSRVPLGVRQKSETDFLLNSHFYRVLRNSTSLLLFSSLSVLLSSVSDSSVEKCCRLLLLLPRLRLEDVDEELNPESGTGDAWASRRKSTPPGGT